MTHQRLQLYLTVEHPCGYFDHRLATNLVPDPQAPMNMALYSQLIQHGFRRSGGQVYRPHCAGCEACIPCRIPVARFKPNRSQRRCLKRNTDLDCQIGPAEYSDEAFALYRRYLNARHSDGDMANPDEDDFRRFLWSDWSDTVFFEIRHRNRLLAVAVSDITTTGLSAVYSFFDPTENRRSLGVYCILRQIEQCRALQRPYLYMGYWIADCRKMQYKANYQPMQIFRDGEWHAHTP